MLATTSTAATRLAPAATAKSLAIHAAPPAATLLRLRVLEPLQQLAHTREDGRRLDTPGNAGKVYRHLGSSLSVARLRRRRDGTDIGRDRLSPVDRWSRKIAQSYKVT
jgi:hypothetical protein